MRCLQPCPEERHRRSAAMCRDVEPRRPALAARHVIWVAAHHVESVEVAVPKLMAPWDDFYALAQDLPRPFSVIDRLGLACCNKSLVAYHANCALERVFADDGRRQRGR